jgi:CRP-like cAMP-binding protein
MAATDPFPSRLLGIIRSCGLFQDLTPKELDDLLIYLRMIRTQKGYEIIRQGDSWESFYVIISGRVSVWIKKGQKTGKVAEIGKDGFFGEMALLTKKVRNATIVSEEVSELLVLNKREFESILMAHPKRAEKILSAYAARKAQLKKKKLLTL